MHSYELNLRDYWQIIRKRRNIIILSSILVSALTLGITMLNAPKPVYDATASVKIERVTSMVGLFVEVLSVPGGDNLATQVVIIKSFPVLERAAKKLRLIPEDLTSEQINNAEKYGRMLSELQSRIKAEQDGNTNIINVTVSADNPSAAQKLANLVAESYREESILSRNRQIFEAKKFIEEQIKTVEEKLKSAEESLNVFKRKKDVISITDEQRSAADRLAALEGSVRKIDMELKQIDHDSTVVKEGKLMSDKTMARIFPDADAQQSIISRLNARMTELLMERDNLLITLLPAHPQVKELDAKIASVRAEIKNQIDSKRSALIKKKEGTLSELNSVRGKIAFLPSTAMELGRLEREVKVNQELFSILKTKYQEVLIKEAEKVEEVSIVKRAIEPTSPKNPPMTLRNAILGLIIGIMLGGVFAFIYESFDTSIGTIEDVEAVLDVPVVGVIPNIDTGNVNGYLKEKYNPANENQLGIYRTLISHFMPKSIAAESYRFLRTAAISICEEKNMKSIMITSSSMNEGKTLIAINLGLTMAQVGKRVLLIDADFRNPALHYYFGLEKEPGLADAILGNSPWQIVVKNISDIMLGEININHIMTTPGMDNISVITSGLFVPHPPDVMNSPRLISMIGEIAENYDFVIFDVPPVLPVTDAIVLGNKVDGIFIVYEVGRISRHALKRTKIMLENVGSKVTGIVLNNLKAESSPDFYHFAYYYGAAKKQSAKGVRERLSSVIRRNKSQEKA